MVPKNINAKKCSCAEISSCRNVLMPKSPSDEMSVSKCLLLKFQVPKYAQACHFSSFKPQNWGHATLALITVLYLVSVCFACCVCMAVELIILTSRRTKIQSVTHSLTQIRGASGEKKKFTNFGKLTYICVHTLVFLISKFQISTFNLTIDSIPEFYFIAIFMGFLFFSRIVLFTPKTSLLLLNLSVLVQKLNSISKFL